MLPPLKFIHPKADIEIEHDAAAAWSHARELVVRAAHAVMEDPSDPQALEELGIYLRAEAVAKAELAKILTAPKKPEITVDRRSRSACEGTEGND